MESDIIKLENVSKAYKMGTAKILVLKDISLGIKDGEFVAIMGPSGSGKSTLMNMVGLLDRPTTGKVILEGGDVSKIKDDKLAKIRGSKIGFVFQSFHLYPTLSVIENIQLPMRIHEFSEKEINNKSLELLGAVDLNHRKNHLPSMLSGGEMQRVAIARALSTEPSIILADEPTGNLDTKKGNEIMQIFKSLNKDKKKTIIIITHEAGIAKCAGRIIKIVDGRVAG